MVVLACLAADGRSAKAQTPTQTNVVRVGGEIKEPTKLKNVAPVYPDAAKQARVQGVVILECTIGPRGDVADVKVLRGIPLLDQAAIDAVKQWVYTPTLLNGVAVPVIMTVTVNFKLSGGPLPAEAPAAVVAPTPAPTPTGSPEKIADIRRLLELNGSKATRVKMFELVLERLHAQARPDTPASFWDALLEELNTEPLDETVVLLYDKYFTQDEIREFIRFYETPAGRKLAATAPVIIQDSMQQFAGRGPALIQKAMERLRTSGYLKSAP
jgi:protein TonB